MNKARIFLVFFSTIGMLSIIYFVTTFIHEYVHYLDLEQGVKIGEFVLLGWHENATELNLLSLKGIAWTEPKGEYNRTKAVEWDYAWCMHLCNLTSLKEYYGIK